MEREESKASQAELFATALALAQAKEETKAEAEAQIKFAAEEAAKPLPGQEEVELKLNATKEVSALYPSILELLKQATGATSCYIGIKGSTAEGPDGEPPLPTITWLAGTEGSDMEGCSLTGLGEDADPEGPPAEGTSFDLFVGKEPPEPEEGAPEPEEGAEPGLIYPEELVVPNVVRHPTMKFFGVPRLGAYAAVPIKYKSCLHADGIGEGAPGGDEAGGEGGNRAAPVLLDVEMLIGMHTMGQAGRQFTSEELDKAKAWAGKVGAALERARCAES